MASGGAPSGTPHALLTATTTAQQPIAAEQSEEGLRGRTARRSDNGQTNWPSHGQATHLDEPVDRQRDAYTAKARLRPLRRTYASIGTSALYKYKYKYTYTYTASARQRSRGCQVDTSMRVLGRLGLC